MCWYVYVGGCCVGNVYVGVGCVVLVFSCGMQFCVVLVCICVYGARLILSTMLGLRRHLRLLWVVMYVCTYDVCVMLVLACLAMRCIPGCSPVSL